MGGVDTHASLRQNADGRWSGRTAEDPPIRAEGDTREQCLDALRRAVAESHAGDGGHADVTLIIEVLPRLAGVAEAAGIIGWDKRRVITYIDRGRFPPPLQSLAGGRVWLWDDVERYAADWHARNALRRPRRPGTEPIT
jgi:hypothetical protein